MFAATATLEPDLALGVGVMGLGDKVCRGGVFVAFGLVGTGAELWPDLALGDM